MRNLVLDIPLVPAVGSSRRLLPTVVVISPIHHSLSLKYLDPVNTVFHTPSDPECISPSGQDDRDRVVLRL